MHARTLVLVFLLVNIVILASVRLLPFIDLPNHLAEATIYKFYEPENLLSRYYQPTPWYFPNSFHTVFCSLFASVEVGNKVFHILCVILLPLSVFLVVKQLKGNAWYAALAMLFTYNYNVTFGFVGFAISIPILILLFYTILLYIEREKFYLSIIIALLLVLLFFMHAQNALMGIVIYGCMMLYHFRKSLTRFVSHLLLIPLPLIAMIVTWWFTRGAADKEESTLAYLIDYYTSEYFTTLGWRIRIAVLDNFQLQEGWPGLIIALLFFICVLVPIIATQPWKRKDWKILYSSEFVYASIFVLIVWVCYLFAPDKLPGQTPIFQRFCTLAILSLIILGAVYLKNVYLPWLRSFAIAAALLYTALWAEYLYSFQRENKHFTPDFFAGMDPKEKLVGLIYATDYRGRNVYIHFPNYYIVWRNGIAASKIIDYRFGVVRRVAPEAELPFYQEHIAENYALQPGY
ncbi:MAG TPA: hypothetical protein VFT90_16895, partial [Chryseosolibacter sp.]|nr:hypothetical protein [Chryseosolibacter sp.]